MRNEASVWRKMLREDLHPRGKLLTDAEVLTVCHDWWKNSGDSREDNATLFLACVFLIYGDREHLEEALRAFAKDPTISWEAPAKGVVRALGVLLPLPATVKLQNPQMILDWYLAHKDQLIWHEELGQFVLKADVSGSPKE